MEQEEINFKPKQEKSHLSSKGNSTQNQNQNQNKIQKIKGDFEKIFGIDDYSQSIELIENYNMSNLGIFIENVIKNPNNTIIIFINPKNILMNMLDIKDKDNNKKEYDFKSSKLFKIWNLIVDLSQEIRDKDIECRAFDINLNSKLKVINKIKIFFAGKNLEFLYNINNPITNDNNDKLLLPIIQRCMKFSTNKEIFDIFNCIKQLKQAMETDEFLFPELERKNENEINNKNNFSTYNNNNNTNNTNSNNSNNSNNSFYNKFVKFPENNFYRILMFNGVITEKINENDFDNLLIKFKKTFKIVFNYFNYEYDYLFEKKLYDIFNRNDLFDFKYEDFHFFLKPEQENSEYNLINKYKEMISSIESLISNFFVDFNKIKNLLFKNQKLILFAKKFDNENKLLINDYNIIKKNYNKIIDSGIIKRNNNTNNFLINNGNGNGNLNRNVVQLSSAEIRYIKNNFEEISNKKVIKSHLDEIKGKIDLNEFENIMNYIEFEINTANNKLINDLDNQLENISNMSKIILLFYYFIILFLFNLFVFYN